MPTASVLLRSSVKYGQGSEEHDLSGIANAMRSIPKRDSAGPGLSRVIVGASTDIAVVAHNLSVIEVGRSAISIVVMRNYEISFPKVKLKKVFLIRSKHTRNCLTQRKSGPSHRSDISRPGCH